MSDANDLYKGVLKVIERQNQNKEKTEAVVVAIQKPFLVVRLAGAKNTTEILLPPDFTGAVGDKILVEKNNRTAKWQTADSGLSNSNSQFYRFFEYEVSISAVSEIIIDVPGQYQHLQLRMNAIGTASENNVWVQFNEDTTTLYDSDTLPAAAYSTALGIHIGRIASTFTSQIISEISFIQSNMHKFAISRCFTTSNVYLSNGRWPVTDSIYQMRLNASSNNFAVGTLVHVYGIL